MSIAKAEGMESWEEFINRWPLEKLPQITLQEYSQAGNIDAFTYWLEARTEKLGSIWGGSAFKFGVYSRDDLTEKVNGSGRAYNDKYAWYSKYGDTAEIAFKNVLQEIISVATAARNGDLKLIDAANLGEAVKWKLAFLYQNRDDPILLPIYKAENLRAAIGPTSKGLPCSALHQTLMLQRNGTDLFIYAAELWQKSQLALAEKLTTEAALAYLQERLVPIREPVQYMAGFKTSNERQLGLVQRGSTVSVFIEQGDWPEIVPGITLNKRYSESEPRISSLNANAPKLSVGNLADKVDIHTMNELIGLCDAYEEMKSNEVNLMTIEKTEPAKNTVPLNQILFGPPGTGKTYATIDETLRVLDPDFLSEHSEDRAALKTRFDHLTSAGHVRFVTFHQSFSYEDFVEGLRAENDDNGQLRYEVVDGVFKSLCDSAAAKVTQIADAPMSLAGRRIWKMSLGNTLGSDAYIYDECIENNYALLGYGGLANFTGCENRDQIFNRFIEDKQEVTKDSYAVTAVSTFILKMKIGDLIIVTEGNTKFRAIGEITGNYRYLSRADEGDWYAQCRDIKWLRVYQPSLPYTQLMHNQFSQRTLYELRDGSINVNLLNELLQTSVEPAPITSNNVFKIGDTLGSGTGYVVRNSSEDLLTLEKPKGNVLPIGISIIQSLADYVRDGKITISDIRDKQVFIKISDSELDPYLVNGYSNILPVLVEKWLSGKSSQPAPQQHIKPRSNSKVLIIDEINRGNISRIFGELITLIEPSKRTNADEALEVTLPYSKKLFSVPSNLYLIGTMNTADRSLAGLDIALRRRFTFKEMPPRPELLNKVNIEGINIGELLLKMNERIEVLLDRDHCLGHAYFMSLKDGDSLEALASIFHQQILPLLQEYFFEDWERIAWVLNCNTSSYGQGFIQKASTDLNSLFGVDIANNLQNIDRRWRINELAFTNIECYRNILGAKA